MPRQSGHGTLYLKIFVVVVTLWFVRPVARINSATCRRILPGMTIEQATNIIGAPPGQYDGVESYIDDSDRVKIGLHWTGLQGTIVVVPDGSRYVGHARFYPSQDILTWNLFGYLGERFTRVRYVGLSLQVRLGVFLAITTCAVWVFGGVCVRALSENAEAECGGIGLAVGLIIAVAVFADLFFKDLAATFLLQIGPILGAAVGVLVAICRKVVIRRVATAASPTEVCEGSK